MQSWSVCRKWWASAKSLLKTGCKDWRVLVNVCKVFSKQIVKVHVLCSKLILLYRNHLSLKFRNKSILVNKETLNIHAVKKLCGLLRKMSTFVFGTWNKQCSTNNSSISVECFSFSGSLMGSVWERGWELLWYFCCFLP